MRSVSTSLTKGQTAHSPSTSNTISDTDTTGDGTRTIITTLRATTGGTDQATTGDGMTPGIHPGTVTVPLITITAAGMIPGTTRDFTQATMLATTPHITTRGMAPCILRCTFHPHHLRDLEGQGTRM